MLAAERRLKILEHVASKMSIHVGELAAEFGVSEMTARRDIARLERDGFLRRAYGGATAHLTRTYEPGFNARSLHHPTQKRLIGMTAAAMTASARTIFLGIGTTAEHCAQFLAGAPDQTIITNSVPIASLLGTKPVRVVGLGGLVRHNELSFIGGVAIAALQRYHFDMAIVGAAGISATYGVTELSDDEAEVQRHAIARADRIVVIADSSKIGEVAMAVVADISGIDALVTDAHGEGPELDLIRAAGVDVHIAESGPHRSQPTNGN